MMLASQVISPDGSNLPGVLARMQAEDPYALNDVSRGLANLAPGITRVEVVPDTIRWQYVVWVWMQDGRRFPPRLLSDGTLRLLALVALREDPAHRGVLCFEEPENGTHPSQFKNTNMIRLLRELATDFSDPSQAEEPLRQLLVNTHSPVLAAALDVERELLFAHMPTRVQPQGGGAPMRVTRITPVPLTRQLGQELGISEEEWKYTLGEVIDYIESAKRDQALGQLRGG
jgi:predicted ATPase